jgi:hypothetical protein
MQIHELNSRKPLKEVDLVGPNSIFNVGKQVLKNPKAAINSAELGVAQQAAIQASASASADRLANPNAVQRALGDRAYTASGSAKAPSTPQQQLAQVQSNPAVQQMVKNLAAQWKTQGVAVAGKLKTANVSEAVVTINPNTKDPNDLKLLAAIQKAEAGRSDASPTPEVQATTNKKLNSFATEFQNWAEPKLRAIGVNLNTVMQDPWATKTIQEILTKLSIESLANPESAATTALVEQFFNVVIATNQAQQQGAQGARQARAGATASASGAEQVDDAAVLKQYGLNMSTSQLDALASAMRRADKQGLGTVRNTGNELLNALVRAAGYKVAET